MQILTDEQAKQMNDAKGVIGPGPRPIRDGWIAILDVLVRVLTLGRGRVVVQHRRAPIRWDGIIR